MKSAFAQIIAVGRRQRIIQVVDDRLAGRDLEPGNLVVGIELTNLAAVHERHGHFAVDAALVHVARLLCGLIRSTDILARTGEGRFDLILDHLDLDSAIDTGERLARCIEDNPLDLGHAQVKLESAVATTGILPGDKLNDVLARAERNQALARAEG